MTVAEIIKELAKVPNQNLPVWIQQDKCYASIMDIEIEEGKCLKLKASKE